MMMKSLQHEPRCRLFCRILAIISSVLAMSAAGADKWHWDEAEIRLLVSSPVIDTHNLRVDLPAEVQPGITGVSACLPDGTRLPCSLIEAAGKARAAHIHIPSRHAAKGSSQTIELYASKTRESPQPLSQQQQLPVAFFIKNERLLARPFSSDGLLALDQARGTPSFKSCSTDFSLAEKDRKTSGNHRNSRHNRRNHFQVRRVRASSLIAVDQPTDFVFAVEEPASAWFLWLNGAPIAGWKNHPQNSDSQFTETRSITLQAGLHRIDYYVVARLDEDLPSLYRKRNTKNAEFELVAGQNLVSPLTPAQVQIEILGEAITPRLEEIHHGYYLAKGSGREFSIRTFLVNPAAKKDKADLSTVTVNSRSVQSGRPMFIPGKARPALQFRSEKSGAPVSLTLPPVAPWKSRRTINPTLVPVKFPVTAQTSEIFTIDMRLNALPKSVTEKLEDNLSIRWQLSGPRQNHLDEGAFQVDGLEPAHSYSFDLKGACRNLNLTGYAQDIAVTAPLQIEFLSPSGPFDQLAAHGMHLTANQNPAVLLLHQAANRPADFAVNADQVDTNGLFVVDEFWGVGHSPAGTAALANLLQGIMHLPVRRGGIEQIEEKTLPELKKFSLLNDALDSDAAVVVWSVGTSDMAADVTPDELLARVRFLAEATLQHGKLPMLTTIPPSATADSSEMVRLHRFGIMVKELGLTLDIPVADLYSRSTADPEKYRRFFATRKADVRLQYPNDAGRRWFCRIIDHTLQRYLKKKKASANARP